MKVGANMCVEDTRHQDTAATTPRGGEIPCAHRTADDDVSAQEKDGKMWERCVLVLRDTWNR